MNRQALSGAMLAAVVTLAAAQPVAPPPQSPANLLPDAAASVGVKRCLPAVSRLSSLAVAGSRSHDILMDWDHTNPDEAPFFSLLGLSYGAQSAAATITVIPQADGGCTLSAERISVAPFTCQSIAQVELNGYRVTPLLPNFNVYTPPNLPGESVSLIDSPPSCLVIRRYVQYGWKPAAGGNAPPATIAPVPARR